MTVSVGKNKLLVSAIYPVEKPPANVIPLEVARS